MLVFDEISNYFAEMKRELRKTADGSTTIYIPEMDENYHSQHGAIQEAEHVFLKHGLESSASPQIRIFEMGFGTGLNALLTIRRAKELGKIIDYVGIEAFPVEPELLEGMNYLDVVGKEWGSSFQQIHQAAWNEKVPISEAFMLTKIHAKIEDYLPETEAFDMVYFDAFGPRAQGVMWELPVLEKIATMLKPGGILVTYCAQGQFKRHLKSLGFVVERLPGPPGKREMTRATKILQS